ncbi:hypothetical protein GCM10023100_37370 [Actinocorallia cavernae]|uniref:Uncharacterized protein n=1 Tax=Actinocorallia cavernae TaxID=328075 RepID=A0ABP8SQ04_9ACTN
MAAGRVTSEVAPVTRPVVTLPAAATTLLPSGAQFSAWFALVMSGTERRPVPSELTVSAPLVPPYRLSRPVEVSGAVGVACAPGAAAPSSPAASEAAEVSVARWRRVREFNEPPRSECSSPRASRPGVRPCRDGRVPARAWARAAASATGDRPSAAGRYVKGAPDTGEAVRTMGELAWYEGTRTGGSASGPGPRCATTAHRKTELPVLRVQLSWNVVSIG